MLTSRPQPRGPVLVSLAAHAFFVGMWATAQTTAPAPAMSSVAAGSSTALPVYEVPAPAPVAVKEPTHTPEQKPEPQRETPQRELQADIAIDEKKKRESKPKKAEQVQLPKTKAPSTTAASERAAQPSTRVADPYSVRTHGTLGPKASEQKAQTSVGHAMSASYSQLIAQAIHRQLQGGLDALPDRGTLLALQVESATGRVLMARVAKSSGNVAWDNRAQAAARQTTIPANPAGPRPQQFTVYIHP